MGNPVVADAMTTTSERQARSTVAAIWRYPVKSMRGEALQQAPLESRGLAGDRRLAIRDVAGKLGSGKNTRRFRALRGLFDFRATTAEDTVWVEGPGIDRKLAAGSPELDALLSHRYGEPMTVATEHDVSHFDQAPVHLLTTASLRWLAERLGESAADPRRFRPNLLLEAPGNQPVEDGWIGATLRIADVELQVVDRTVRCVMPNLAQEELAPNPAILRRLGRDNDTCLGVYANVVVPGTVRLGDTALLS